MATIGNKYMEELDKTRGNEKDIKTRPRKMRGQMNDFTHNTISFYNLNKTYVIYTPSLKMMTQNKTQYTTEHRRYICK